MEARRLPICVMYSLSAVCDKLSWLPVSDNEKVCTVPQVLRSLQISDVFQLRCIEGLESCKAYTCCAQINTSQMSCWDHHSGDANLRWLVQQSRKGPNINSGNENKILCVKSLRGETVRYLNMLFSFHMHGCSPVYEHNQSITHII